MKRTLYLTFLLFTAVLAQAQGGWAYLREGLDPMAPPMTFDIHEEADGSIISCGTLTGWLVPDDTTVLYVQKLTGEGEFIWETLITLVENADATAFHINKTQDNGYVLSGVFDGAGPLPGILPIVVKLDSNGIVQWNSYDLGTDFGPDENNSECIAAIQTSPDIISVLTIPLSIDSSYLRIFNLDIYTGEIITTDYIIFPFDLPLSNYDLINYDLTSDGGIILSLGGVYSVIWKLNSDLESEWYNDDYYAIILPYAYFKTVKGLPDGGCICSGTFFDGIHPVQGNIARFDNTGNLIWDNYYENDLGAVTVYGVCQRVDGNFAAILIRDGYYIMLLNSDGDSISSYQINIADLPNPTEAITATSDNGFAVTAGFHPFGIHYYVIEKSSPEGLLPDCVMNCVWPGDANNNGIANMEDLLTLGVGYDSTGIPRDAIDDAWLGHNANPWAQEFADGTNYKYADCNGDGTINSDDTLAISLNYESEHPVFDLRTDGGEPTVYLDPDFDTLPLGLVEIPVLLDNDGADVELYGIVFSITYEDDEKIDSTTLNYDFTDCWLGAPGELLIMQKTFPEEKRIDVGITRIDHTNVTGSGQIGTLSFVVIDNIAGRITGGISDITFSIHEVTAIKSDEEDVFINGSDFTFHLATGIENENPDQFIIYPNPVSGNELFIYSTANHFINELCISDITGRTIFTVSNIDISTPIEIPSLPNGEYTIKVRTNNVTFIQKLMIIK